MERFPAFSKYSIHEANKFVEYTRHFLYQYVLYIQPYFKGIKEGIHGCGENIVSV